MLFRSFGSSYLDMFSSQLSTYQTDFDALGEEDPIIVPDANQDGRTVLTNSSVVDDFRKAYVKGNRTVDDLGIAPFPKPNWQLNYSGLSNWPLLRRLTQSITLRHSYSGDYAADFNTNTTHF